ncbi:MAG: response regulator transcription factor [Actinomycetota bacterium]|nr:response regulator transcription factor [Actinomycetota bacterium]
MRVLLVDDSAAFRTGMTRLLATIPDVELCGTAGDGADGVHAALKQQPDVVLMDIAMPQTSGIEATRILRDQAPHIGVVVMTMLEDDDAVAQALRAGARGYLVKGAPQAEIVETIRGVYAGRAVIGAATAKQLGNVFSAGALTDPFPELTPRERTVLEALAGGSTTSQIAARLGLSQKTVRNHLSSIFTKLRVADRTQAVIKARAHGLGS